MWSANQRKALSGLKSFGKTPSTCSEVWIFLSAPVSYTHLDVYKRQGLPDDVIEQVEIQIKYAGYIKKQLMEVEEIKRLEQKKLPEDLDYG